MIRNVFIGLLAVSFVGGTANATIEEWTSASTGFTIDQIEKTILITAAGTYKFQSYDGETPDDIRWIRVNSGFSGTVTIHVDQDPNDGDGVGAANVKEIDLTETNVTGNLARLYISGDLATDGDVVCDSITGDIDVAGSFGDGPGSITYDLRADTGTGDIGIAGDCVGDLSLGTYNTGEITIGGLLLGDLDAGEPHDVTIAGTGDGDADRDRREQG